MGRTKGTYSSLYTNTKAICLYRIRNTILRYISCNPLCERELDMSSFSCNVSTINDIHVWNAVENTSGVWIGVWERMTTNTFYFSLAGSMLHLKLNSRHWYGQLIRFNMSCNNPFADSFLLVKIAGIIEYPLNRNVFKYIQRTAEQKENQRNVTMRIIEQDVEFKWKWDHTLGFALFFIVLSTFMFAIVWFCRLNRPAPLMNLN